MSKFRNMTAGRLRRAAAMVLVTACVGGSILGCGAGKSQGTTSSVPAAESSKAEVNADTTAPEITENRAEFPIDQRVYAKELVKAEDETDQAPVIKITSCDGESEVAAGGEYVIFKSAGNYNVGVSAEDSSGNAAKVTLKVTAYNKVLPQITLAKTEIELADTVKGYDFTRNATAKSPIYGDLTDKIKVDESQVVLGKVGTYKVVYSVEDKDGNKRTASMIVKIKDTTAPTIKLPVTQFTVEIGDEKPDYLKGVKATDEVDGDVTSKIKVDDTEVKYDTAGSYPVVYLVTDAADNLAKMQVTVVVKKKEPTPTPTPTATATPTATPTPTAEPTETPESTAEPTEVPEPTEEPVPTQEPEEKHTYILDTGTKVYHEPGCAKIDIMKEQNKEEYTGTSSELEARGYSACDLCNP